MRERTMPPWALILAGGDDTLLRPLTRQIVGDARPKQFCALVGGETLLDQTRRRVDLLTRLDHQMIVVTRAHEPYYHRLVRDLAPDRLVIQPENRGTAPGILYPILKMMALAGDVPLAIVPSDHYVSDDQAFMASVGAAVEVVRVRRDLIVLLGIEPTRPETEYGWIGPGYMPLPLEGEPVFPIRRFWEKPTAAVAERLFLAGCFWNSFVMVGWAGAFIDLLTATTPALTAAFAHVREALGTSREARLVERVYARLAVTGFSEAVLAHGTERLGVMRVKGVDWSDWGNPRRVLASLSRAGVRPGWLERVALPEAS